MKTRIGLLALALLSGAALSEDRVFHSRSPLSVVDTSYTFPSSANTQGIGAYFKTRMVFVNPSSSPMTVNALLSTPSGPVGPQAITLAAGQTKVYENFLSDVFGYTGGAAIRVAESTGNRFFIATGEVYADGPNGRYSTAIFGLSTDDRVASVSESGLSLSVGLRVDAANRANFGCANADGSSVSVQADFYTSAGGSATPATSLQLDLAANAWSQAPIPVTDEEINVRFRTFGVSGTIGVYCWGVNVNNQSADGLWVPAVYVLPSP